MAILPFVPFFALKDFGQMLIFSGAYTTLYLVAVRRWPQLLLFVGSVVLVIGILVVGALPRNIQEQVPLLPTIARPISAALPLAFSNGFISGSMVSIRRRRKSRGGSPSTKKR